MPAQSPVGYGISPKIAGYVRDGDRQAHADALHPRRSGAMPERMEAGELVGLDVEADRRATSGQSWLPGSRPKRACSS
jgi:hypothetical protein